MSTGLVQITPPANEPLTLQETKEHLRVDLDADDTLILSLIKAARRYVEKVTDRQLVTAVWQMTMDRFPRYSASAVWQYNSDAIWQQRLPVTQLSGQWYPDRAAIRLRRPPCQSVSSIDYVDGTGTLQTLATSVYMIDTTTEPARVAPAFGNIWPIVRQQLAAVTVTYVAGYGTPDLVPDSFKAAMKLLIGNWYEHREAAAPLTLNEVPQAVNALLMAEWDGEYT